MKNKFSALDFESKERFYKLPKELVNHPRYKKLSNNARTMYAILRDRTELSYKNNWIDDQGYVYIIFTINSLQKLLNVGHTTVIKIKKELADTSLLEESRLGMNKPNRIYLLKPDISVDTGLPDSGSPESGNHEFQKLEGNDTEYSDTKRIKDTNKDTSKEWSEILLNSAELTLKTGLVSEVTIRIFKIFNNPILLRECIDIVYATKIKVENYENKENELSPKYSIYGDIWIHEIDKQALKFFQKVKELEYKEIPIKKVKNYWYTMMETFWENVLLMDKNYGFNQLEYWSQIGQLEIEDFFIEFNAQTKGLSKSDKKKKRYEIVYKAKFQ